MRKIIVVAHNLRSTHNVGSLLRTAEGLGVEKIYLSGYTPYPMHEHDVRLPHLAQKIHNQIQKTALGAEQSVQWLKVDNVDGLIAELKQAGYTICGLEQSVDAVKLPEYAAPEKVVIILGREVEGLESEVIEQCDKLLEIPMFGKKESFNVVQAAAMALFHLRFN